MKDAANWAARTGYLLAGCFTEGLEYTGTWPTSWPWSLITAMRRSGSSLGLSIETPMASTAALMSASVSSSHIKPDLSKSRWPSATSKKYRGIGLCRRLQLPAKPAACLKRFHRVGLTAIYAAKLSLVGSLYRHQLHAPLALRADGRVGLDFWHDVRPWVGRERNTLSHR
jgi:hypothetical protein